MPLSYRRSLYPWHLRCWSPEPSDRELRPWRHCHPSPDPLGDVYRQHCSEQPATLTDAHLRATGSEPPLNATPTELNHAINPDPSSPSTTAARPNGVATDADIDASKDAKHGRKGSKILNFFKGTTRGMVKTAVGTDTVRAKAGSEPARNRLGVIPAKKHTAAPVSGPVEFDARWDGHRGRVILSTSGATVPVVAFSKGGWQGEGWWWRGG